MKETVPPLENKYSRIVEELANFGWSVCDDFLETDQIRQLADEARAQWQEGGFRQARVGTGSAQQVRTEIRSDFVHWLDESELTAAQRIYWDALERLRREINQTLFLGLFEFEGHLTVYPGGAFYRKHLDQFKYARQRVVTCILYLNQNWRDSDRGQLRLYLEQDRDDLYRDILPQGGRLVIFISEQFYHEVLPAQRERMSLTGWFRTRN